MLTIYVQRYDKRCIYASSEHLKMINLFISYGITEDNVSSLMIVLWDGVAKKAKSLIFKCERERIGWCVGPQKVNQDFICLLLGKRRYELLSMIEQSDIIRAISLPNATLRGNWLFIGW